MPTWLRPNWPAVRSFLGNTLGAVGAAILLSYAVLVVCGLAGCSLRGIGSSGAFGGKPPDPNAPNFAFIGWLAALCLASGVLTLVASFTPWLAFFPRKSSVAAILAAPCLWLLQGILIKFFGTAIWAVAIVATLVAAVCLVPWVIALVRWSMARAGQRLAIDDPRAGVALIAAGKGWTAGNGKDKKRRKQLLSKFLPKPEVIP